MFSRRKLLGSAGAVAMLLATAVPSWADKIVIGHSQPNLGWPYIAAVTNILEEEAKEIPTSSSLRLAPTAILPSRAATSARW